MPSAGDLRHRIAFQKRVDLSDGYGNTVGDWQTQFTVSAAMKPLRGGEDVLASRLSGVQPVVLTVRRSTDTRQITPAWRAVEEATGTAYNITAVADTEDRRAFLDIMATSGQATG